MSFSDCKTFGANAADCFYFVETEIAFFVAGDDESASLLFYKFNNY